MFDLKALQKATGYTPDQLRDRIAALEPVLDGEIHRGKQGRLLVGDRGLAILRRLRELEDSGLSPKDARRRVMEELRVPNETGEDGFGKVRRTSPEVQALRELVEELRRDRDHWRDLALRLEEELRELRRLALPPPRKRRGWWTRFLRSDQESR